MKIKRNLILALIGVQSCLFAATAYAEDKLKDPIKQCLPLTASDNAKNGDTVWISEEKFRPFTRCIADTMNNNYFTAIGENPAKINEHEKMTRSPIYLDTFYQGMEIKDPPMFARWPDKRSEMHQADAIREVALNALSLASRQRMKLNEKERQTLEALSVVVQNTDASKGEAYSLEFLTPERTSPLVGVKDLNSKVTYRVEKEFPGLCDKYPKDSDFYLFCTGQKTHKEPGCQNSYGDPCGSVYDKSSAGYSRNDDASEANIKAGGKGTVKTYH